MGRGAIAPLLRDYTSDASGSGNLIMTKSELIEIIAHKQKHLPAKDVELAVKHLLELMSNALANGERIEIRGFGSFSLHYRPPRMGRNPKTGDSVALSGKYVPHFKPGKELREKVNESRGIPIKD
jgi:integration host factor subunit beta